MYDYHNGLTSPAPGLVAVVGLAVRPQAGVVLPGGLRRRDERRDLRRGQPRHLVARHRRRWPSPRSWPSAVARRRWRSSPSGSPPSGSRGRGSTGPPSSTTTTRRCRSWSSPSPTSWPSCGTAPRGGPGCWSRVAAAVAIVAPAAMWLLSRPLCALVGVTIANPGSQACPAVIPEFVLTVPDAGPARGGRARRGRHRPGRCRRCRRPRTTEEGAARQRCRCGRRRRRRSRSRLALAVAALLPDTPILTLRGIPVEPIALVVIAAAAATSRARSSRPATPGGSSSASASPSRRGSCVVVPEHRRRCPCRRPSSTPTRASCRPTCTRSSSRSTPTDRARTRRCSARSRWRS